MIKLALIDDHELVLESLCNQLRKEERFEVVGSFTEVQDLILCLKYRKIDILIMDLMLKDTHGFDLIQQIKELNKDLPKIIILSGFYDIILHKRAYDLGVKAFLPKECSYYELISTVFNVYKGYSVIPDNLLEEKGSGFLTDLEIQILKLIAEECSNEKIAKELFISRRTVDTHVTNICSKLNVTGRVGAVREAVRLKIV